MLNWVLNTIVVASDGAPPSTDQLASARALARATGAKIVVVHIIEIVRGRGGAHPIHADEDGVARTLQTQVNQLHALGLRAELEIRASADGLPAALSAVADKHDADLIVVRRGNRSWWGADARHRMIARLERRTHRPVLTVN